MAELFASALISNSKSGRMDATKPAAWGPKKPGPCARTSTIFTASSNSAGSWPNSTSSKPSTCAPQPQLRRRRKKNLKTQCLAEKYRETEHFLAQARQKIACRKQQETLTQWFETDLRDAFARDARRMIEDLFNDRQLIPDDAPPLPCETVHNNRPVPVHTLFGTITLKRRYFHPPILYLENGCVFTQTTTDKDGNPMRDPDPPATAIFAAKDTSSAAACDRSWIKAVIGRRLKQSGMFWGEAGAENIQQLRCLLKSPHFEAARQARRPIIAARQAKARRWSEAS